MSSDYTGKDLQEWRTAKGMTREDLAVLMGYSHQAVVRNEQKGLNPLPADWSERLSSGEYAERTLRVTFDLGANPHAD